MKKVLISLDEELLNEIDERCANEGINRSKYITAELSKAPVDIPADLKELMQDKVAYGEFMALWRKRKQGVKIPKNKWTKNELSEFLGITQLDKRWVTFMDNIEKIYYE